MKEERDVFFHPSSLIPHPSDEVAGLPKGWQEP
jgi:hypothetical protein